MLTSIGPPSSILEHSHWLNTSQYIDAFETLELLTDYKPDWLVVDHYAIDITWEMLVATAVGQILVIDDLADRQHFCNVILDQTYGRAESDYNDLVPCDCQTLTGSKYALLRPEFAAHRPKSLARRVNPVLNHVLISLGGVDKDNITAKVLNNLLESALPERCKLSIIMGQTAPWLHDVKVLASKLPWSSDVLIGVTNMAEVMTMSDFAIGAAGATTWERCCLGLPSAMIVLATNQLSISSALNSIGGAISITDIDQHDYFNKVINELYLNRQRLTNLSQVSQEVTDGMGTSRVLERLKL